jgi:hypothetical protein
VLGVVGGSGAVSEGDTRAEDESHPHFDFYLPLPYGHSVAMVYLNIFFLPFNQGLKFYLHIFFLLQMGIAEVVTTLSCCGDSGCWL